MSSFNRGAIRDVKRSTVAIGLANSNLEIVSIVGTGFIVDSSGIIITAGHVFDDCKTSQLYYSRHEHIETRIAAFRPFHTPTKFSMDKGVFSSIKKIKSSFKNENLPLFNIDLAYGLLATPFPDVEPMSIESEIPLETMNQVGMCGFPAGKHALDTTGEHIGHRFSPTFQLGRIGSLLPFDDAPNPYGIQTDIIGVGGSSGSPLIDPATGTVVGLAQKVLPANVETTGIIDFEKRKELQSFGSATIGQVYGISNHVLFPATKAIKEFFSAGKSGEIKIDITGLDFGSKIL